MELTNDRPFGLFDVYEIARSFPQSSDTLLLDTYLTNEEAASARIFRVYKETPPHYHATCDEYLYGTVRQRHFLDGKPRKYGRIYAWKLAVLQAWNRPRPTDIFEWPVVFLSIDTPRRDPKDIIFVNPEDGTPEKFIRQRP